MQYANCTLKDEQRMTIYTIIAIGLKIITYSLNLVKKIELSFTPFPWYAKTTKGSDPVHHQFSMNLFG